MNKGKVIVLDFGIFSHRSIFAWRNNKKSSVEYTCLNMIIACLRRVGVEPMDEIIVACDGKGNWRKAVDSCYKANRKEFREKQTDIDWGVMYGRMNALLTKIDDGTDWQIIKLEKIEADDIGAVACRFFKDREVVLVSYDKDWEQLTAYDNVKLFSPLTKEYKIVKDPYLILAQKIEKETSDNLINPILTEADYNKRKMIVSLLELPDFVEDVCIEAFKNIKEKEGFIDFIPFPKMREKIAGLYNDKSKIVTYESCLNPKKKRKKKTKKRK